MEKISDREKRILDNYRFVYYLVNKYFTLSAKEYEDAVSIGMIGLIKAVDNYDETKNIKFGTYAATCIRNEILMSFRKNKKFQIENSLSEPISTDIEGHSLIIENIVEDPKSSNFIQEITDRETFIEIMSIILNGLHGRERIIILYSIGGITQKEIAQMLNISQSYISRLVKKILEKIKTYVDKTKTYKEVFSIETIENKYLISFSKKDMDKVNETTILQKKLLSDIDIYYNGEIFIIYLPNVPESFVILAEIINEIDNGEV